MTRLDLYNEIKNTILGANTGALVETETKTYTVASKEVKQVDRFIKRGGERIYTERVRRGPLGDELIIYMGNQIFSLSRDDFMDEVTDYEANKLMGIAQQIKQKINGAQLVEDDIFVPVEFDI